jgi:transcription antitermination factor NusG
MSDLELTAQLDTLSPVPPAEECEMAWYAVLTRPRHEKKAASGIEEKGIQVLLPLCSSIHQWSDRRRMVRSPLFPGYLFVRILASQETRIAVLRTGGVLSLVGSRGIGAAIPDEQIEAVQVLVDQGIPLAPHPYINVGQRVRIRGGCLEGLEGILVAKNGDQSLVVSVEMIQRSLAVRVSGYQLERI